MKNQNKKAFTIVELVIVIAVIAILAAVLIPTFSGVAERANQSVDIQTATQMNLALTAGSIPDKPATLDEVMAILADSGFGANHLTPVTKHHKFYWYPDKNVIFLAKFDKDILANNNGVTLAIEVNNKKASIVYPGENSELFGELEKILKVMVCKALNADIPTELLAFKDIANSIIANGRLETGKDFIQSYNPSTPKVNIERITLNQTQLNLVVGGEATLTATVTPDDATFKTVSWSTADPNVVTVDQSGNVEAKGAGTAAIIAKADGKKAVCLVYVSAAPAQGEQPANVPVDSVTIAPSEVNMIVGTTAKLTANISPVNATNKSVTWSSSEESVVTVDQNGNITAEATGEATITATVGGKTGTCTVTVIASETPENPGDPEPPEVTVFVTGMSLNTNSIELNVGGSYTLLADITPANATNKAVTWASSNEAVATVADGIVTAVAEGQALITAVTQDGAIADFCTVKVTTATEQPTPDQPGGNTPTPDPEPEQPPYVAVDSIEVNYDAFKNIESVHYQQMVGKAAYICIESVFNIYDVITVKPDTATDKTLTWRGGTYSGNLRIDENGNVRTVGKGEQHIVVTASSGTECTIYVNYQAAKKATSVTIRSGIAELEVGKTHQLGSSVNPANVCDPTVSWTSSNPDVASVDATGMVTAKSVGDVTITLKAEDGSNVKQELNITVKPKTVPVSGITLDKENVDLVKGDSIQLTATVSPANATNKTVSWSVKEGTGVVTVDQEGNVTAVDYGTATITAWSHDPEISATCKVTVSRPEGIITVKTEDELKDALGVKSSAIQCILEGKCEIRLDADITLKTGFTVGNDTEVVIDLNNHKLTTYWGVSIFVRGGSLTIKNGTCLFGNQVIVYGNNGENATMGYEGGSLHIDSTTVEFDTEKANDTTIMQITNRGGTIEIKDSTITDTRRYISGNFANPIDVELCLISNAQGGTMSITRGAIRVSYALVTGVNEAIFIIPNGNGGQLTLSDVEIDIPKFDVMIMTTHSSTVTNINNVTLEEDGSKTSGGIISVVDNGTVNMTNFVVNSTGTNANNLISANQGTIKGTGTINGTAFTLPIIYNITDGVLNGFIAGYENTITEVIIPDGVTEIRLEAFANNKKITKVVIPDSVTKIGNSAFYNCSNITEISIGTGVIGPYDPEELAIGTNVFKGCTGIVEMTLPECGNGTCIPTLGYLFGATLDGNGKWTGESNKPVGLYTTASSDGFKYDIKTVIVLGEVGNNAFANCSSITSFEIDSATKIGVNVFRWSQSLQSIVLPEGVTSIEAQAFLGCTALKEITIPAGVTSIAADAFDSWFKNGKVYYQGTVEQWEKITGRDVFKNKCVNITIYINGVLYTE